MKWFKQLLLPTTIVLSFLAWALPVQPILAEEREIQEYQGKPLAPFDREYDNSIRGPQTVDPEKYRLKVTGLVEKPLKLTYQEVLALPSHRRAITLDCVEGWDEHLLFEGVRLKDILDMAGVKPEAKTVIFFAEDGYSSSLSLKFVLERDLLLAAKINGRVLDAKRGFPFQVVAESKYGYKWVKWVTGIKLYDKPYRGYWEKFGYDNNADVEE